MSEKSKTTQENQVVQQPARRQLIQFAAMAGLGASMGVSTDVLAQTPAAEKKDGKVVKKGKEAKKVKKPTEAELAADKLKKGKVIDIPKP